jgi:hypothetical protein
MTSLAVEYATPVRRGHSGEMPFTVLQGLVTGRTVEVNRVKVKTAP